MTDFVPGAPAPTKPSWAVTGHDNLALPDGRTIGAVETGELHRIFDAIGLADFSHSKGRTDNVEAYAAHLKQIHDAAGAQAVAEFLAGKPVSQNARSA
jgi:hypothetical protein